MTACGELQGADDDRDTRSDKREYLDPLGCASGTALGRPSPGSSPRGSRGGALAGVEAPSSAADIQQRTSPTRNPSLADPATAAAAGLGAQAAIAEMPRKVQLHSSHPRGTGNRTRECVTTRRMRPEIVIPAFDSFLADRKLNFDGVIIGGSALSLLGLIVRGTRDCDVLAPQIPPLVLAAAREFAKEFGGLDADWLNGQAYDFTRVTGCLPDGWRTRLRAVYHGTSIRLMTLGSFDLLCTKLVALIDRGQDYEDCKALRPTAQQLKEAWPFVEQYEGNPESREKWWIPLAKKQLNRLARDLGYSAVF